MRGRHPFRNTLGLQKRLATRLQPNHPTDDLAGIAASLLDGLLLGSGDAVIGINPASDNVPQVERLLHMLKDLIGHYGIPTQSCVLTHVTNTLAAIERGAPVDLVFQSIGGTEATNSTLASRWPCWRKRVRPPCPCNAVPCLTMASAVHM